MNAAASALKAIKSTQTWQRWCDPSNIGAPDTAARYLENRFEAAFLLGVQRGEEIAAERIKQLALGYTPPAGRTEG